MEKRRDARPGTDRPTTPTVTLVQLRPEKAKVRENLSRVRSIIASLADEAELALFPEASLSGYFLEGGVERVAISAEELIDGLGTPVRGAPDVALGFFERWAHRVHNSVAYLEPDGGKWRALHIHRKVFLPTYGLFDEGRFIEAGEDVAAFDTGIGRLGMLICEDMWHSLPATVLALDGAELILVPSASPVRGLGVNTDRKPTNLRRWDALASAASREHGVFVAVAQLTGSEGGKVFPGGSAVFAPDGKAMVRAPLWEDGTTAAEIDWGAIARARATSPLLGHLRRAVPHLRHSLDRATRQAGDPAPPNDGQFRASGERTVPRPASSPDLQSMLTKRLVIDDRLVEGVLVEFIRDELTRKRGFQRLVVGVSGGVDSAVALFLACRALGPENVHALRLPYRTSSPESLEHARLAIDACGATEDTIEITGAVDGYIGATDGDPSPLRRGNVMARVRAVVIFDQSARLNALPLGTGNKSERLLGYFTWHADDSPPLNPLGDLYKTQVWSLARHLGVPPAIVEKPATADLVRGVTDEDELGVSYGDADPILDGLLNGCSEAELADAGFDETAVSAVALRLRSTHWKRELPTVAVLSSSAIGESYLRPVDY